MEKIIVYGKEGWPYTVAARDDLTRRNAPYEYFDVKNDKNALLKMLEATGGARKVPVIVQGKEVTIGFGGAWGV